MKSIFLCLLQSLEEISIEKQKLHEKYTREIKGLQQIIQTEKEQMLAEHKQNIEALAHEHNAEMETMKQEADRILEQVKNVNHACTCTCTHTHTHTHSELFASSVIWFLVDLIGLTLGCVCGFFKTLCWQLIAHCSISTIVWLVWCCLLILEHCRDGNLLTE